MSERHFRRLRDRYEAEGAEGIVDRRLGRASARRAPLDQIEWVLELYRPRRPLPGMLVSQDGSPHRWLVALGRDLDLIATMDDATTAPGAWPDTTKKEPCA